MKTQLSFLLFLGISLITWAQTPTLKQQNNLYALATPQGKALSDYYNAVYDFEAGIAIVRTGTKFGAIDKNGKIVIPVNYSADEIKQQFNQYLENFVKANPNNQEVLKYLAQIKEAEEQKRIAEEKQRISVLTKKANSFYNKQAYDSAIFYYKEALAFDSIGKKAAELLNSMGLAYSNLNQSESALFNYQKALEIDSISKNAAAPYCNIADIFSDNKNHEKALTYYYKAINLDSNFGTALNNLGFCANKAGKYQEAKEALEKAISLDLKAANSNAHLGFSELKLNNTDSAKIYFEKAQTLNPKYNKTYFYWACYYAQQKQTDLALENLKKAIELGFTDKDWIQTETILNILRNNPEFKKIIEQIK